MENPYLHSKPRIFHSLLQKTTYHCTLFWPISTFLALPFKIEDIAFTIPPFGGQEEIRACCAAKLYKVVVSSKCKLESPYFTVSSPNLNSAPHLIFPPLHRLHPHQPPAQLSLTFSYPFPRFQGTSTPAHQRAFLHLDVQQLAVDVFHV